MMIKKTKTMMMKFGNRHFDRTHPHSYSTRETDMKAINKQAKQGLTVRTSLKAGKVVCYEDSPSAPLVNTGSIQRGPQGLF